MSLFGECLRELVLDNQVNVYGFAKTAKIERTLLHKIMSGARLPSTDYLSLLVDALPISPQERQRLLKCYDISKVGEFKYNQRIQVKSIIESIAAIEDGLEIPPGLPATGFSFDSASSTTVTGHFAVNNLIKALIEEAVSNSRQEVDFVIPESYLFFYNELLSYYLRNPKMRIRHVIAFSKKLDMTNNTNKNLHMLSQVMSFSFAPASGYFPCYYYQSSTDADFAHAMPYFLLTSSGRLLLIGKDLNRAALISDPDIVNMYRESFSEMLVQSTPLIKRFDSAPELLAHLVSTDYDCENEPYHWIEPEPCIGPFFSDEEIDGLIMPEIPFRNRIVELLFQHYDFLRSNQICNINVCTAAGLKSYIDSGHLYYSPKEYMIPAPRDMMRSALSRLSDKVADNKVKLLFTNPSKFTVPGKLLFSINKRTGINFILCSGESSALRAICLSEDSINEAFADFIESIESSELVFSASDSLALLNNAIGGL